VEFCAAGAIVRTEINFKHLQLYHLGLGAALEFGRAFPLAASSAKNDEIQA